MHATQNNKVSRSIIANERRQETPNKNITIVSTKGCIERIIVIIKKVMLLFCREYCLKKLTDKGTPSSYAELHRILEEEVDVGVSTKIYVARFFKYHTTLLLLKILFRLPYSDALQSQIREETKVAYMDEIWVWRYHSTKKGVALDGTTHYWNIKLGKGEHLIVIDAITEDDPLRCNGAEMTASVIEITSEYIYSSHGGSNSLGDDESREKDIAL